MTVKLDGADRETDTVERSPLVLVGAVHGEGVLTAHKAGSVLKVGLGGEDACRLLRVLN